MTAGVWRSRFFWKLYLTYAALVAVTVGALGLFLGAELERGLVAEIERGLTEEAELAAVLVRQVLPPDSPQRFRRDVAQLADSSSTRFTVILPDGVVLADSEGDPVTMENHADRPEVLEAGHARYGVSRRYSETLGHSMLYVAHAVHRDTELLAFVRLAVPLASVDARRAEHRTAVFGAIAGGTVLALVVGWLVAGRITRPLRAMTEVAQAMESGDYTQKLNTERRDEIGALGRALDRLGSELSRRIATISDERARLRAMLAEMVEGVIAVDADERVLFVNAAAAGLLGFTADEATGKKVWEVSRNEELQALIADAARGATAREVDFLTPSGAVITEVHAAPFHGGDRRGVVAVLHDLTEIRRVERVRRDFVANVSHELKTPLTSILGYVETLLDADPPDQERRVRYLQKIQNNAVRLEALVRDLLDLARIESADRALGTEPVDVVTAAADALRRHDVTLQRHQLSSSLDPTDRSIRALADPEGLQQILDNLIDNAIKYTPPGGAVRLTIEEAPDHVTITVADTGIGIPTADLDRVFERFFRVDRAHGHRIAGTGLGLSIVRNFVLAMNGEITVESTLGEGSRFELSLPRAV